MPTSKETIKSETVSQSKPKKQVTSRKKPAPKLDLSPYISNPEGSVYAISNLPEEFVATLFAWVSRSPKSFKDSLADALKEFNIEPTHATFNALEEKAKAFHEKWTVGYGHSSVAEHANAHVGIEDVSRLASADLELSNQFYGITEYSQRYQRPERGAWINPFPKKFVSHSGPTRDMKPDPLHQEVEDFYNKAFDTFELLIKKVYDHLTKDIEDLTTKESNAFMKLAFEDARYALPLGMKTQLGMTANGRAWRDGLAHLGNSDYPEVQSLANDLKDEITKVLPVLLRHATPSQYQRNLKVRKSAFHRSSYVFGDEETTVQLENPLLSEVDAIRKIRSLLALEGSSQLSYSQSLMREAHLNDNSNDDEFINMLLHEMEHFDMAPDLFKHIHYTASFLVSEANWHQLLRHNRKTEFTFMPPSADLGLTIPPRIKSAGCEDLLTDLANEAENLSEGLKEEGFELESHYVVLNAHRRRVVGTFSLWEAYHLINLRTSPEAQWDIKQTFEDLFKQIAAYHPRLIAGAKRRLK